MSTERGYGLMMRGGGSMMEMTAGIVWMLGAVALVVALIVVLVRGVTWA